MLTHKLATEVNGLIDQGDESLNADDFSNALAFYLRALSLIPDPKYSYDVSLPAFTALGEAYFYLGSIYESVVAYKQALKCPGGVENPLLHLRLGQAYLESGDLDSAADSLTKAYALGGEDVFVDEDEKYFAFLRTRIQL